MRRLLLGLLCTLWLVPGGLSGADEGRPTLRMLCIGNSFSLDGTAMLPALLAEMGVSSSDYGIDCAVVAGASLEYWWKQYCGDSPVESLYHMGGALQPEPRTWTLRELLHEPWDVVVVQQASRHSDRYGTIDLYLKRIIEAIRSHAPEGRTPLVAWQLTWSGAPPRKTGPIGVKGWQRIARTASAIERQHDIDVVIPTGTALQNVRYLLPDAPLQLTRDGLHLAFGVGRYVAALTWYEMLFAPVFGRSALGQPSSTLVRAVDAVEEGFLPITDEMDLVCRRAVEWALRNPFQTADSFTAAPLPSLRLIMTDGDDTGILRTARLTIYDEGTVVGHQPSCSDTCRVRMDAAGMDRSATTKRDLTLYIPRPYGETVWQLDAMADDPSRLRGLLCQTLWRDMGWEQMAGAELSRPEYVEVYLDGQYHGIYVLRRDHQLRPDTSAHVPAEGGVLYVCGQGGTSPDGPNPADAVSADCRWGDWELLSLPAAVAGPVGPTGKSWQPLWDFLALTARAAAEPDYVADHLYEQIDSANWVDYCLLLQAVSPVRRQPFAGTVLWCPRPADGGRMWLLPPPVTCGWGRDADGQPTFGLPLTEVVLPWEGDALPSCLFDTPAGRGWSHDAGRRWDVLRNTVLSGANVSARIDSLAARLRDTGAWQREWRRWRRGADGLPENLKDELSVMKRWYHQQHLRLSRLYEDELTPRPARIPGETPIYLINGVRTDYPPVGLYIRNGVKYYRRSP